MTKWGIKVEWEEHGLECCGWLWKDGAPWDLQTFATEDEALAYLDKLPQHSGYDRILAVQEMVNVQG